MPSYDKELMFNEVKSRFERSEYAFISNFEGLTVSDISGIRGSLEKVSDQSLMVKHTIAKKALSEIGIEGIDGFLGGAVVITFGSKDPQDISKAIVQCAKDTKGWKNAGVIFEGEAKDEKFVAQLAKLPSKQELLTQVVVRMNSPIVGFASVLSNLSRGLVIALDQIKKQKEAAPAS